MQIYRSTVCFSGWKPSPQSLAGRTFLESLKHELLELDRQESDSTKRTHFSDYVLYPSELAKQFQPAPSSLPTTIRKYGKKLGFRIATISEAFAKPEYLETTCSKATLAVITYLNNLKQELLERDQQEPSPEKRTHFSDYKLFPSELGREFEVDNDRIIKYGRRLGFRIASQPEALRKAWAEKSPPIKIHGMVNRKTGEVIDYADLNAKNPLDFLLEAENTRQEENRLEKLQAALEQLQKERPELYDVLHKRFFEPKNNDTPDAVSTEIKMTEDETELLQEGLLFLKQQFD